MTGLSRKETLEAGGQNGGHFGGFLSKFVTRLDHGAKLHLSEAGC
ncbi:hypothetical protein [Bradyrhizobium liaoningense]|nr:hypothetical protein [Bradyrhizobium liaoningense]